MSPIEEMVHQMMLKNNGKVDYTVEFDGKSGNSEGYLGDIIFFTIKQRDGKITKCIMKTGKNNVNLRKTLPVDETYARELYMYSSVFPTYFQFLNEKNQKNLLNFIPKLHHIETTTNKETLILENLKARNFDLLPRSDTFDLNVMKFVFETYGKYHGVSMAFRDQHRGKFDALVKDFKDVRKNLLRGFNMVEYIKSEHSVLMKMLKEIGRADLVKIYEEIAHKIEDVLLRNVNAKDFICITHGDPWINNYMFKFKNAEKKQISDLYFLDFQLATLDSPMVDVASFFYNVAGKNCYLNFEYLLKIYHDSLSETITKLGSNPMEMFSFKDLKRHWAEHGYFDVLMTNIFMKIQLCETDESPDLLQIAENGGNLTGAFCFESVNIDAIRKRVLDAFVHYGEFLKFYND